MLNGASHPARSGQALIELLPSLVLFFMVISASLAYFRIMRAATIRQETVRNLMFAKIDNSGTLTSPASQESAGVKISNFLGSDQGVIPKARNNAVYQTASCFVVSPKETRVKLSPTQIFGIGILSDADVEISSYAVMFRYPSNSCPQ